MNTKTLLLLTALTTLTIIGCKKKQPTITVVEPTKSTISLRLIKEIDGFEVPECFIIDPATGHLYVSNVVTDNEGYWVDDNNGYISQLDSDANIKELKWLASTEESPIHAPKGMTILDGYLYFTDNAQLKRVPLTGDKTVEQIELPETEKLNDLATDGTSVYVTDTALSKAYKVETDGSSKEIPAPESVNGITAWQGKIFAVSWDLHEVYELDPAGVNAPVPFGLADHFTALDGIEILDDGTFIVSDFDGNKISAISPDRKTVTDLAEAKSAADIAIDRDRKLLYVPMLLTPNARVYEIVRE